MAFKLNRSSKEPMSEINVTPFVDVMLVLLIIFMVTAPLLTVGVQVDLPETSADSLADSSASMFPCKATSAASKSTLASEIAASASASLPSMSACKETTSASNLVFIEASAATLAASSAVVLETDNCPNDALSNSKAADSK